MKQEEVNAIVEKLVNNGAEIVKNVTLGVTRVTEEISEKTGEPYSRVSMATDKPIKIKTQNEKGAWVDGEINNVMELASNMNGVLKSSPDYIVIISHIERVPDCMEIIIPNATCDIIVQPVKAGELYKNPFSKSDSDGRLVEHDTYYHHIVNIRATDQNKKYINTIVAKKMGI